MIPTIREYNPYYQPYIDKAIVEESLAESLINNGNRVVAFYKVIPAAKLEFRYAEGKWSIKEILLHLIDTERIFAYRALRIARQDETELSGFEQDDYVISAKANERSIQSLIEEYNAVRGATITLFNSFNDIDLQATGIASGSKISVRAIGYILIGHENHHNQIIKERYL